MKEFPFYILATLLVSLTLMIGCNAGDPFQALPPPTLSIVKVDPAENEADVPVDQFIQVTFENDIDEKTLNRATFLVNNRTGTNIAGSIEYDTGTRTATYKPLVPLRAGIRYEVNVDQVKGINGEFIPPHVFYFTTASELLAQTISPRNGSEGVKVTGLGKQEIFVRFNRSIDATNLSADNFFAFEQSFGGETGFATKMEANLEYDDSLRQLTLRPLQGRLKFSTHYYVTLRDIPSIQGSRLNQLNWEFRTDPVRINAVTPSAGAIGVSTSTPIEIFFQGAVDKDSVIGNIKLRKAFGIQDQVFFKGEPVFDQGDTKVTFQTRIVEGDEGLEPQTRYEILIRGVKTIQDEFFQEFRSTFTTGN